MKPFEKNLLVIQSVYNSSMIFTKEAFNLSDNELTYLSAKGLIELRPFYDNKIRILLTNYGITYFDDKKDANKAFVLHWTINFGVAVMSAVFGSVLTLFIQQII